MAKTLLRASKQEVERFTLRLKKSSDPETPPLSVRVETESGAASPDIATNSLTSVRLSCCSGTSHTGRPQLDRNAMHKRNSVSY